MRGDNKSATEGIKDMKEGMSRLIQSHEHEEKHLKLEGTRKMGNAEYM